MALETATYISDLVATNPVAGDPVSQADDHLRLLKSTLKNTFTGITGAVTATHTAINDAAQRVLTSGTVTATTTGTTVDFTSIPSWVKRITLQLVGVSTNGTSNPIVQIGDSGGIEATGYLGSGAFIPDSASPTVANYTTGFGITGSISATSVLHGRVVLSLVDAANNTWMASATGGYSNAVQAFMAGGSKSLSATLDRVRLTTVGGVNTFDAGSVNILYE